MYTGTRHASLQAAAGPLTHVMGVVGGLEIDLGDYRRAPAHAPRIALDVGDVCWRDEPIRIEARPGREGVRLRAQVRTARAGRLVARTTLRPDTDGGHAVELAPLGPGSYRVIVSGGRALEPTEDVFVVVSQRS